MSVSSAWPAPSLRASIMAQLRVILALMIREGQSSYTQETLGFFWVIAEPLILTCGVIALWTLGDRTHGHASISIVAMALSAYTHLQLWRLGVLPSMNIIKHGGWLLYHRNVNIFDVIVAHVFMKSVSIFASFVIIASVALLLEVIEPIRDPGLLVAAWGLDTLFVLSSATFISGFAAMNEYVEKIMHPLMYLTLPLTGAFTLTGWLPTSFRVYLAWSPLANCCEMFRAAMFPLSIKTYYSVPLILGSSLVLLAIGLPVMFYARRDVVV